MKKINCKCHEDVDIAVGGVLSRKGCCLAEHDGNTRAYGDIQSDAKYE